MSFGIYKRLDCLDEFGDIFRERKEHKRKKLVYHEIEHVDNPCVLTLAVSPKEYFELCEDENLNKKHKGIKKGSPGLGFKNFAGRIKPLVNFYKFEQPPQDTKQVSRFAVVAGKMVKTAVTKNKFSQLNYEGFYFPDGIVSLPFYHPNLTKIDKFKQKKAKELKNISGKRKSTCSTQKKRH